MRNVAEILPATSVLLLHVALKADFRYLRVPGLLSLELLDAWGCLMSVVTLWDLQRIGTTHELDQMRRDLED